jgi:hypothetical protein
MRPHFWSSEITVLEKMREKTTSIPTQKSAVAAADGNNARHDTLVESRNHILSHQGGTRPAAAEGTQRIGDSE